MGKISDHDLVAALKRLADELGKTPTLQEFIAIAKISRRQTTRFGTYNDLVKMAGLEPNKVDGVSHELHIRPPRILFFDLELAPIKAYVWALFDQNVGLNQITDDWFIMSYSAKYADSETIYYLDQRYANPVSDDRQLVEGIHELIRNSDVVVGHNSDAFDVKKLNARFIKYGLEPLHTKQLDTLKICRRFFKFTSNKLEYVAQFLECTPKDGHKKFPGFALWSECLKGNMEAWEEMYSYNCQDVLTTEEVFYKLAKYDPTINLNIYDQTNRCICGSNEFKRDGYKYLKSGVLERFRCKKCSKVFTSKGNLVSSKIKQGLFQ